MKLDFLTQILHHTLHPSPIPHLFSHKRVSLSKLFIRKSPGPYNMPGSCQSTAETCWLLVTKIMPESMLAVK